MNRRQFLQNALKAAAVVPVVGVARLVGEPVTHLGVNLLPDVEFVEYDLGMPGDTRLANNIVWAPDCEDGLWVRSEDGITPMAVNVNGQQRWIALYSE